MERNFHQAAHGHAEVQQVTDRMGDSLAAITGKTIRDESDNGGWQAERKGDTYHAVDRKGGEGGERKGEPPGRAMSGVVKA